MSLRLFFKKWGCFMKAIGIAKWFLLKNPSLLKGGIDENLKLNTLLCFSNLMYFSVFEQELIDDGFEKFGNVPVVKSVYDEYKYSNLCESIDDESNNLDPKVLQVLEIINFVYGDFSLSEPTELYELTETENEYEIEVNNISHDIKEFMLNLYNLYKGYNFDNIGVELIHGNRFIYFKDELELTEDILNQLKAIEKQNTATFIEMIDGELVFS